MQIIPAAEGTRAVFVKDEASIEAHLVVFWELLDDRFVAWLLHERLGPYPAEEPYPDGYLAPGAELSDWCARHVAKVMEYRAAQAPEALEAVQERQQ